MSGGAGNGDTGGASTGGDTSGGGGASGGESGGSGGSDSDGTGGGRPFGRSSAELFEEVKLAWNLGNSLDVPDSETAWSNPLTTAAHLQMVADHGFQLVRIPVTWSLRMGPAPSYTIEPAWLERVEEVVNFALDADLYAVINLHHDGARGYEGVEWLSLVDASGDITEANNVAVRERFVAVWSQIAAHFASYGEELLFESMNEIHNGYTNPEPGYYDIINDLNQTFVDLIRQSGGNNAERHLIVPGYNTNIEYTLAGFDLPQDPTPSRLSLSVHYYDPWPFAGAAETNTWGQNSPGNDGWGQEDFAIERFNALQATYIDQGVPVFMGEYGAVHQAGFEEYRRYYMEYVTKAAVDRGIVPVYWDNGSKNSGAEAFGLFDRDTLDVMHPTILDAMQRAATSSYAITDIALPSP